MLPDSVAHPATDLPVRAVLPELFAALEERGTALLVAPPGTGKTTLVPLALADRVTGRVLVAEPRRIAVRAAARRMASLLGEPVGERVGYAVRGERRTSARTRVEVVTTGLLLRRLLADPDLEGVGALVLDEVHERHLDADLVLGLAVDVREVLRPDLWLLAASATPDAAKLARALAGGAAGGASGAAPSGTPGWTSSPVVTATAPRHPLDVVWCPPLRPLPPPVGGRVDRALLDHVARVVHRALDEREGDVLVFLPGAREIAEVQRRLGSPGADVLVLSGSQSAAAQDAVMSPGERRRVVLSTAVAESSVTVPGVRVVVDAGLARLPRADHARGMSGLVTVPVSQASADQRAGRAARLGPGAAYRCWSESDHHRLPAQAAPEIATTDLTAAALVLAGWGDPTAQTLSLPDPPPAGALAAGREVLTRLGALDRAGSITARGRAMAAVPVAPRAARALLDGAPLVGARTTAEVVALLDDDGLLGREDDLVAGWRALQGGAGGAGDPQLAGRRARWKEQVRRLLSALDDAPAAGRSPRSGRSGHSGRSGRELPRETAAGLVVALAHPERVARRVAGRDETRAGASFLTTGGTALRLAPGTSLGGASWLAVAVADRTPGSPEGLVRAAVVLDEATALEAVADQRVVADEVRWAGGDVVARRVERCGALVLTERRLVDPPGELVAAAVAEGLAREGLAVLRWTEGAVRLRQKLAACHRVLGAPWPSVTDEDLLLDLTGASAAGTSSSGGGADASWLGPELARVRRRADLQRIDVASALRRLLPWPQAGRFEQLVPDRLDLPGGGTARLDYADPAAPFIAVKLQQLLGWQGSPAVLDGAVPVVLHLLSPAGRPLAVTADLASFWRGPYRDVRAEMRGRYPKHAWPEDPLAATPAGPRSRPAGSSGAGGSGAAPAGPGVRPGGGRGRIR